MACAVRVQRLASCFIHRGPFRCDGRARRVSYWRGSFKAPGKLARNKAPFVPVELAQALDLKAAKTERGPLQAETLAKELRAVVRERRKLKQPHEDVLRALYGACVLSDLVEALKFEGNQSHHMAGFVSACELQSVQLDYATMGYQEIEGLGKTDVKWLVDAFGEPAEHQSFNAAWPFIWQNAVSRKCWSELAQQH